MNFCSDCTNKNCPEEMPDQNSAACKHFKGKKITKGDLIRSMSNEGIAAFVCGVLNDRREETFRAVLDFINAPAESEGEDDTARD